MSGPIPAARLAWYVTGRFYEDAEGRLQDLGYFLHLAGVAAPLFSGPPGEATALLTFRSAPFQATAITNGNVSISLDPAGSFSLYRCPGGADFADPGSFSQGEPIALFRRLGIAMGDTIASPLPGGLAVSTNVFSAELVRSVPFELGGARYDLRDLLPHGVTQWGTSSANPLPAFAPYQRIVAFTGSAIAAGG